ncbi:cohesin domain-containing protein [Ligaoa zhengdingensis]|uniref:cohesin domain-containing protein n=1 Tax=Ligaoa zhengdingensis TaxID=2763658 RepID=UPI0031BBB4D1
MKLFCRILAIILTITAMTSVVYAANCKLTATLDRSTYQAGDTVSVTYELEGLDSMDNDGIAAFQMTLYYDTEFLMIKEIRPLGEISASELSYNAGNGKAVLIYVAGGGSADPIAGDPLSLFQVVFTVRSSTQQGKTEVRVEDTAFAGIDGTEIQSLQVSTGSTAIQIGDGERPDSGSGSNGGAQHNKPDLSEVETPIAMLDGEMVSVNAQSEPEDTATSSGEERQEAPAQANAYVEEQGNPEVLQHPDQQDVPEQSETKEVQQPKQDSNGVAVWFAVGLAVAAGVAVVLVVLRQKRRKEQRKDEKEAE